MKSLNILAIAFFTTSLAAVPQQPPMPLVLQACPVLSLNDPALPVIPKLSVSNHPVQVKIEFSDLFVDEKTDTWKREEQDNICKAAAYVQVVWSSNEFRSAVEAKHKWIVGLNYWTLGLAKRHILGTQLYHDLLGDGPVVIRVSVSANTQLVPNYALSDSRGWTVLQRSYLDQTAKFDCLSSNTLISCLTDTFSHEYTHYGVSISSTDGTKGAVDNDDYVSYGIGDLTQSLAFPSTNPTPK